MTSISETGRAELVASIADLAEEVARLAHSMERVVTLAKTGPQDEPAHNRYASKTKPPKAKRKPRKAECAPGDTSSTDVSEEAVTLSPVDEPTAQSSESLVAASISDLYERLGGFLNDSLQPPHQGDRSSK